MARLRGVTVNPFEETRIAGDVGITPHQRVQQERDLRIHDAANLYRGSNWRPSREDYQTGTRFVDRNYPPAFGDLMAGKSGHPFRGGFGPKHKYQPPPRHKDFTDRYNPLRRGLESIFYKVLPEYRNMIGFETPDWVDEYTDRDVPEQDNVGFMGAVRRGLHDTGKIFHDYGMFSDDTMNLLGWRPEDHYYGEGLEEYIGSGLEDVPEQGIMSFNRGGSPHLDRPGKIPLDNEMRDQMYDWILEQIWRQKEREKMEEDMRMPYVAPDAILET